MLTRADIDKVQAMFGELRALLGMRARLDRGDPMALMIGEGKDAGVIALAPAYLAEVTGKVKAELDSQITGIKQQLTDMGVKA